MLQGFVEYIRTARLFKPVDRILLAVSGGVDSMVMVQLFADAGFNFGIAHFNFGLRGDDSAADAQFVKQLAEQWKVPFFIKEFDTRQYASSKKISIQMAARELRYTWFDEIMEQANYQYVATAHHLDDQAETFFINLLRGTGISGMHGILPRQGKVIRPLMYATRNQIMDFAVEQKIEWREDQSNKSRKYLRNKIRLDVLGQLFAINPQFSFKLNEAICHLRDVEEIFNKHMIGVAADLIQHTPEGDLISIDWVYEYTPHDTYLFELLKPYGFTFAVVREIVKSLDTFSGKVFYSQTHRLLRDRENFIIQSLSDLSEKPTPSEDFLIHKHDINLQYPVCLCLYQTTDLKELPFGKQNIACLDFDKLHFPLHIRRWQQGDWFVPLGIKGRKKLSDFFVDQKLSLAEKEKIWLLLSGDEIVWVIGHRIDNRYRITSKTTKAMVISGIDETGESETMACGCSLLFS